MGYLSEVAITLKNSDFNVLVSKAKQHCSDAYETIKQSTIYSDGIFTTMHFDWSKWYITYDDVHFIKSFLTDDISYHFVRIGEEYGDIEVRGNSVEDEDWTMQECAIPTSYINVGYAGEEIEIE